MKALISIGGDGATETTEWYVYQEGQRPIRVVTGRAAAVGLLFDGYLTTETERARAARFLERGVDVGEGLTVVGYEVDDPTKLDRLGRVCKSWLPDRKVVRVYGPQTD